MEKIGGRAGRGFNPGDPITYINFPTEELTSEQIVEALKVVVVLPHIEQINFYAATRVNDEALMLLRSLPHLWDITMWGGEVTDVGMSALAEIKSLRFLSLSGCTRITDEGVKRLTPLNKLETLTLSGTRVSGKGVKLIATMKTLTHLRLGESELAASERDDLASLVHLKEFDALTVLDASLQKVYAIPNLTRLTVADRGDPVGRSNPKVTDAGLKGIAALAKLERLELDDLSVTGAGLKELAPLKNLTYLSLVKLKLGDTGLESLAELTKLKSLNMRYSKVTDKGLKALSSLKNLTDLDLSLTDVTEAGVEELQKALPKCKISK